MKFTLKQSQGVRRSSHFTEEETMLRDKLSRCQLRGPYFLSSLLCLLNHIRAVLGTALKRIASLGGFLSCPFPLPQCCALWPSFLQVLSETCFSCSTPSSKPILKRRFSISHIFFSLNLNPTEKLCQALLFFFCF